MTYLPWSVSLEIISVEIFLGWVELPCGKQCIIVPSLFDPFQFNIVLSLHFSTLIYRNLGCIEVHPKYVLLILLEFQMTRADCYDCKSSKPKAISSHSSAIIMAVKFCLLAMTSASCLKKKYLTLPIFDMAIPGYIGHEKFKNFSSYENKIRFRLMNLSCTMELRGLMDWGADSGSPDLSLWV